MIIHLGGFNTMAVQYNYSMTHLLDKAPGRIHKKVLRFCDRNNPMFTQLYNNLW